MYSSNDLKYVCGFIDEVARRTRNKRITIIERMGKDEVNRLYNFADVYHCMSLDEAIDEFQDKTKNLLEEGCYNNLDHVDTVPGVFRVGYAYTLVIKRVGTGDLYKDIVDVYSSIVADIIDNYHSDGWYSGTNYLEACYRQGKVLEI